MSDAPLTMTAERWLGALADAWDAGWDERDGYCSEPYSPRRSNPYRVTPPTSDGAA